MTVKMAGRDTPGEQEERLMIVQLVVSGVRTEVTEMTALIVVLIIVLEDLAPTWTSPPYPFPPSSELQDEEERAALTTGVEEEESLWRTQVPRTQSMLDRDTAEEEHRADTLDLASSFSR